MNSKQISGLAVVSIAGGHKLGSVNEVYLDPELRKVQGYSVAAAGGHSSSEPHAERWLPVKSLNAIGPDALTVREDSAVQAGPPPEGGIPLSEVLKRTVVTEGGTLVGQIASLELDGRGAAVTEVEVSSGFFKSHKTVTPSQIVSVGDELMVVRNSVLEGDRVEAADPEGASSDYRFLSGDVKAKDSGPPEVRRVEARLVESLPIESPGEEAPPPAGQPQTSPPGVQPPEGERPGTKSSDV